MEEEKKILYEMVTESWNFMKKYCFRGYMTEKEWEEYVKEIQQIANKYKAKGDDYWFLFRKYADGISHYIETKQLRMKGENKR